jgi:DNA-binding protein H-NS
MPFERKFVNESLVPYLERNVPWLEVQFAFENNHRIIQMTTSYADLKAQIAVLEKQAAQVRDSEISAAKTQIREIMQTYGLTIADLGGATKAPKARKPVEAKYRDTSTGEEWTGRGRAPKWLNGKNKEDYLIK